MQHKCQETYLCQLAVQIDVFGINFSDDFVFRVENGGIGEKKKALPKNVARVTFNAITKQAVTEAMAYPRELDHDLIDAYRARRALEDIFQHGASSACC